MDKGKKKDQSIEKKVNREVEEVLLEAEIIARWRKKPFYIS